VAVAEPSTAGSPSGGSRDTVYRRPPARPEAAGPPWFGGAEPGSAESEPVSVEFTTAGTAEAPAAQEPDYGPATPGGSNRASFGFTSSPISPVRHPASPTSPAAPAAKPPRELSSTAWPAQAPSTWPESDPGASPWTTPPTPRTPPDSAWPEATSRPETTEPQQFSRATTAESQQFSRSTTAEPQQFSRATTAEPQQFSRATTAESGSSSWPATAESWPRTAAPAASSWPTPAPSRTDSPQPALPVRRVFDGSTGDQRRVFEPSTGERRQGVETATGEQRRIFDTATGEQRRAADTGEFRRFIDVDDKEPPARPGEIPDPPRRSRGVTVGIVLLSLIVLIGGGVVGVVYYTGADDNLDSVLQLGAGDSGKRTATAPVDNRSQASFELLAASNKVSITIGELGDDLYRISTPEDAGFLPSPTIRNDDVKLQVTRDGDGTGGEIDIVLAAKVRWALRLSGYAEQQVIDLSGGQVSGIEMVAGMRTGELKLARPTGTVPIKVNGAVEKLTVRSPAGSPVRVKVGGGAQTVVAGNRTLKNVAPGSTLTPKNWAVPNRYDVGAGAPITALTVENT
jgi:hypothetical protein